VKENPVLERRRNSQRISSLVNFLRYAVYLLSAIGALVPLLITQPISATPPLPKRLPPDRIDLRPKLVPGEVLLYRLELQTITDTRRTGAISDPQGPSRLLVTWDATVKLEVLGEAAQPLSVSPAAGARKEHDAKSDVRSSATRIRTTYQSSAATVKSDSPDPQAEDIEQSYKRLEGQIIEFTIGPDGQVSGVQGLKDVLDTDQVRQAAEQWMAQVSGPAIAPNGVTIGQTWNSAVPAISMPLADMIWRSSSTYLRNESCRPAESDGSGASPEMCAVIETHQSVVPRKQLRDPTPEDYRRNGLHTAGHWTGSGESLSYVSLDTHLAVSVTQDSSQQIDFTVTNASGNSVRYAGTVETHSRVELLPPGTARSN
jgi:hypothetical protein